MITRWPNNEEVSADGIGEANEASNAVREQQRVRAYKAPSVDELILRYVYSQKTNERLDYRMVAEGRERSQDALGTKTVRGRFVDNVKYGRVKSRFVAQET